MNSRPVAELLAELHASVRMLPERKDAAREARARALVEKLPLVHRTGRTDEPETWQAILRSRRIRAGKPCTEREERLGSRKAAYFFFGHPAWPHGLVAFLVSPRSGILDSSTFTPFDSGGIETHMIPIEPTTPALDDPARDALLMSHAGEGRELCEFAGPFIASHVREPGSYVSYPRYHEPDWPPFHGYRSPSNDRRSWTIEIQAHEDVPLDPPQERIEALVVGGKDVSLRLDDEIFSLCTEVETEDDVEQGVIDCIMTKAAEAGR